MDDVQLNQAATAGSCGAFGESELRRREDGARDNGNGGRGAEAAQHRRSGAGSDAERQRTEASSPGYDWQARDDEATKRRDAGAGGDVANEQEGSGSEEDEGDPAHDQGESGMPTLETLLQIGKPVGAVCVCDGVLRLHMFDVQGKISFNFCLYSIELHTSQID